MKQPYLKENFETVYPRDKEEINLQDCIQVFFWIIKIIKKKLFNLSFETALHHCYPYYFITYGKIRYTKQVHKIVHLQDSQSSKF